MSRLSKILFLLSGLSLLGFVVARFLIGGFVPYLWIPFGLFMFGWIAALFFDRAIYFEFLSMKTTKHGMNMGLMILMVVLLLATLNYLSIKHYKTFDFSLGHFNSLSEQSVQLLKGLDSELKITFFYKEDGQGTQENRRAFQTLVKKYQDESPKVVLDFVEVNQRPDLAESFGVTKGSGVVFLEYKGRRNLIEKIEEQEITGALTKAIREKDKSVYLVTGHGEGGLDDTNEAGLSELKHMLEGNRYIAHALSLANSPKVPEDADALVIAGARDRFLDREVAALQAYLKNGGSLLLAIDPKTQHGLDSLLKTYGIEPKNNFVITVMESAFGKMADPSQTAATEFSSTHNITKVFGKKQFALFRLPQALDHVAIPGLTVDELVKTGENSFGFPDTKFEGEGQKGPFTLGLAIKGKIAEATKDANLVVFGNSQFLSNQLIRSNANRDVILNSIMTLAKEDNMVTITPKEVASTQLELSENSFYLFLFAFAIPLPLLMLGTSGWFWYQRKNA